VSLAFLGTPEIAVPSLRALVGAGHEIDLVVTRPDRRRGRGPDRTPSPVKAAAEELGLAVSESLSDLDDADVALGVVVAFGRIIPAPLLERLPMLNVHFSLLPRWRGAAPVERAILAGDATTGVSLMALDAGLDTGPVYRSEAVEIGVDESADELASRLAEVGARLLVAQLSAGVEGLGEPVAQRGASTYAEKLSQEDFALDWELPAEQLSRVVRLGRAWTTWRGARLRILRARPLRGAPAPPGTLGPDGIATGDGWLAVTSVQGASAREVPYAAWLRGARPGPGETVGG
jgi:methionyl-tRNA formyltransferase